jgi:hypothetical protein
MRETVDSPETVQKSLQSPRLGRSERYGCGCGFAGRERAQSGDRATCARAARWAPRTVRASRSARVPRVPTHEIQKRCPRTARFEEANANIVWVEEASSHLEAPPLDATEGCVGPAARFVTSLPRRREAVGAKHTDFDFTFEVGIRGGCRRTSAV